MFRARITAVLAGCIALTVIGAPSFSRAEEKPMKKEEKPIKKLMGENFAGLQTILVALIHSNYAAVPAQAEVIHEHAVDLTQMVPEGTQSDRQTFLSYAYNLAAHALDMKSIAELLIQHDQARTQPKLATDQLREALAAHYGGTVEMCVACHNRFRKRVIQ